jgi:hypothetical protein
MLCFLEQYKINIGIHGLANLSEIDDNFLSGVSQTCGDESWRAATRSFGVLRAND